MINKIWLSFLTLSKMHIKDIRSLLISDGLEPSVLFLLKRGKGNILTTPLPVKNMLLLSKSGLSFFIAPFAYKENKYESIY